MIRSGWSKDQPEREQNLLRFCRKLPWHHGHQVRRGLGIGGCQEDGDCTAECAGQGVRDQRIGAGRFHHHIERRRAARSHHIGLYTGQLVGRIAALIDVVPDLADRVE